MPAIPSYCAGFSLTATCTSASPSLQAVTARPPSTPTSPPAISSCTHLSRRGRFRPRSILARLGRIVRSDVSRTAKRQERDFCKRSRCANVVSSSETLVPDSTCGNSLARIHLNISDVSTVLVPKENGKSRCLAAFGLVWRIPLFPADSRSLFPHSFRSFCLTFEVLYFTVLIWPELSSSWSSQLMFP